ncbi:acyl-CoA synthetase [Acrocarpospora catenulata]|uniref:acyl-CoA synthetase n=1 Tax=Acrocarpospora catenulata TaxID=2836182 RepID=UPI001BD9C8E7|nr:AMP-binding protein [Acrocarpospora catenulata]
MTPLAAETAAEATDRFSWDRLWALFDGDEDRLNIAHECLDRHDPAAVAARIVYADGTKEVLTFGTLSRSTARFAHWLTANGVGKGDPVGVMIDPSPRFYTALFGVIKAGAVAVPLYTLFGPDAIRDRVTDCGARLVICEDAHVEHVTAAGVRAVSFGDALWAELASLPEVFEPATSASDRAVLQYTSGTTRQLPDAVVHDHRSIVTLARAGLYALGLAPGDRYFCPSSPAWGHGLWHGTIAPWSLGIALGTYSGKFAVDRFVDGLKDLGVTNLAAASTVYRMVLSSGRARELTGLRKASYTGEELDEHARHAFQRQAGVPVCGMYGTTETGVVLVNFPGFPDHEPRGNALGRPMPGCRLAVLGDDGAPVGPGVKGELAVWRRGDWFPSKDLTWTDEDGYFYYGGRADDVIISAGWTISPLEVERVLLKHPMVEEVAVTGIPDGTRGLAVKAWIVTGAAAGRRERLTPELQALVKEDLSPHEYPRSIEYVPSLPKTPNGKVDRRALRAG